MKAISLKVSSVLRAAGVFLVLDQVGDGELLALDDDREVGLHSRLGEHRQELAGVPLHAGADRVCSLPLLR